MPLRQIHNPNQREGKCGYRKTQRPLRLGVSVARKAALREPRRSRLRSVRKSPSGQRRPDGQNTIRNDIVATNGNSKAAARGRASRRSVSRMVARKPAQRASVYSYPDPLPPEFCEASRALEKLLGCELWLMVQNRPPDDDFEDIAYPCYKGFQAKMPKSGTLRAALLIESPGGAPDQAFRICRLFQRRTRHLTTIVAQYAKSAATMMALAGDSLILGKEAEMGPLDIQVLDREQERFDSALNAVQALERVNAFGMVAVDQTMALLLRRMLQKRTDVLLPMVLEYVASTLRPLFEKVDTVDYARKSRQLKVVEEYAARLMRKQYGFARAKEIARHLVTNYPDHSFVIDRDELLSPRTNDPEESFGVGIKAEVASPPIQDAIDRLIPFLDDITAIGRIEDVTT